MTERAFSGRRRGLLAACLGAAALAACGRPTHAARIGLALGSGGARGLAHLPMLETFDELGIRPHRLAGTSIGAVFAALHAAGLGGAEIRRRIAPLIPEAGNGRDEGLDLLGPLRLLEILQPTLAGGGLLSGDAPMRFIADILPARRFGELQIPLRLVAADLATGQPVVMHDGDLLEAIRASIAVPGLFPPVQRRGRHLVDGGVANPLPYDLLQPSCDAVVAVDVSSDGFDDADGEGPSFAGVLLRSVQAASRNLIAEKLACNPPDLYIHPNIRNVRLLEFYKAERIFAEAEPARRKLKRGLARLTGQRFPGCSLSAAAGG